MGQQEAGLEKLATQQGAEENKKIERTIQSIRVSRRGFGLPSEQKYMIMMGRRQEGESRLVELVVVTMVTEKRESRKEKAERKAKKRCDTMMIMAHLCFNLVPSSATLPKSRNALL